jgi:hypothetical protein
MEKKIYYSNTSTFTNYPQQPTHKHEWPLHYLCQNNCDIMQGKQKEEASNGL